MQIQKSLLTLIFLFSMVFMSGCKKEEAFTYKDPDSLAEKEFTFIPSQPTSKVETKMIFYGCSYYVTSSVLAFGSKIEVVKTFNSEQEWPCVLKNDTINFGKLYKGIYNVSFKIVDTNPAVTDSIVYVKDKTLIVAGK